ncbi:MAG: serine/threonine protein [Planctomycetota bacterium]|nr:MAG: serine/threonine protein [Planctomycetota bacterium]
MREAPGIELLEQVSVTNLSEVWRGRSVSFGAPVAVKFAAGPASAASLSAEAEIASRLVSRGLTGIVPAHFVAYPEPHLVLPWMGGRTLRHIIDGIRTEDDRGRACRILMHVMVNTAAVHREGVLHGDLKPENILIGEGYLPWLTDFGMARLIHTARLDNQVSRSLDTTGEAWGGTLPYLPPEGLHGDPPSLSWDVYAIGVMLHEVLMDRRPDRAASPEALRAYLPWEMVDLLVASLAWSPADRLPDMPRFCDRLRPYQEELALTGIARIGIRIQRRCMVGVGAFFILYRHLCALALLATYAGIVVLAVLWRAPIVLLCFLPFVILHFVVRWEGPETNEEAALRKSGQVKSGA